MKWIREWNYWWYGKARNGRMRPWLTDEEAHDPHVVKGNIGCGTITFNRKYGWHNLDQFPNSAMEIDYLDLCHIPYGFPDDHFDYLLFSNVLEHIPHNLPDYPGEFWYNMLEELVRITKDGGVWEIQGPDPRDAVETLQVGGHARLVGPHTFRHMEVRYEHGSIRTADFHDGVGAEIVDVSTYYQWKWGMLTDWHLRNYLGRRLGDVAAKVLGRPGQIRVVIRIHKEARA